MKVFLSILLFVLSALLVTVILVQPHKSEGLTTQRAGSSIFGESAEGGPLVKITIALSVAILVLIVLLGRQF